MKNNIKIPEYIKEFFDKYKYPVLVFAIGLLLLVSDGLTGRGKAEVANVERGDDILALEQEIKDVLEKIDGVGRAEVMLSLEYSEQNVYAKEERQNSFEEIVVINEGGSQKALLEYTMSPVFKGALVVCDGGDNSKVKLEITDAVKALTGISSQKIIILKMKK